LSNVDDGFDIEMQDDGTISTNMGTKDLSTIFDVVPQFNHAICEPLFDPSNFRVTLNLEHKCGGDEVTNIGVKATTQNPLSVFKHTDASGLQINNVQNWFTYTA